MRALPTLALGGAVLAAVAAGTVAARTFQPVGTKAVTIAVSATDFRFRIMLSTARVVFMIRKRRTVQVRW